MGISQRLAKIMACGTYDIESSYLSLNNVKILTANISKCSIISENFQADGLINRSEVLTGASSL
jgi:hypothetical protein